MRHDSDVCLLSFCLCNRTNDQWSLVPSRFIGAGTEERIDGVRKSIIECVDEESGLYVVEGHHSLIKVHVDSNPRWSDADRQAGWRLCSEGVLSLIAQAEEPVAVGGAYGDLALPVDRPAGHSQVPISLPTNVHLDRKQDTGKLCTSEWNRNAPPTWTPPSPVSHLPVMSPWAEALLGQHTHHPVKTLWVVGDLLMPFATADLLTVCWDNEARMGCVGI